MPTRTTSRPGQTDGRTPSSAASPLSRPAARPVRKPPGARRPATNGSPTAAAPATTGTSQACTRNPKSTPSRTYAKARTRCAPLSTSRLHPPSLMRSIPHLIYIPLMSCVLSFASSLLIFTYPFSLALYPAALCFFVLFHGLNV